MTTRNHSLRTPRTNQTSYELRVVYRELSLALLTKGQEELDAVSGGLRETVVVHMGSLGLPTGMNIGCRAGRTLSIM